MTLKEVLLAFENDEVVSIGAGSAYFYIGSPKDFKKIKKCFAGNGVLSRSNDIYDDVMDRPVKSIYTRNLGLAVIVAGEERGRYWTLEEFVANNPDTFMQ